MFGLLSRQKLHFYGLLLTLLFSAAAPAGQSAPTRQPATPVCQFTPVIGELLTLTRQSGWAAWISQLSGETPVYIAGSFTRLRTRYSPAMFSGRANAQAYTYVSELLRRWYPDNLIEEDPYPFDGETWKNLILEIPGTVHPEQVVVLSAHLDSVSQDPTQSAPGASDNASGAAALLEAARIFRHFRFDQTIRIIFFTGEEQGMIGSKAYVRDHDLTGILGVLNLDMFGFDQDGDRCFELHVGTLPESAPLGQCFRQALGTYQPDLRVDFLDGYNMRFSDHSSFWDMQIGALEVLENYSYNSSQNGCLGVRERNPNYHRTTDTLDQLNLDTGFAIARSALATAAGLAHPLVSCFATAPDLRIEPSAGSIHLSWDPVPGAEAYQVLRSVHGCSEGWERLATVQVPFATDTAVSAGRIYRYQVEAVTDGGACVSLPSSCLTASMVNRDQHSPATAE